MTKESSKRSSKRSSKNIVAKSVKKKGGRERVAGRTQKLAHAKACKQVVGRT